MLRAALVSTVVGCLFAQVLRYPLVPPVPDLTSERHHWQCPATSLFEVDQVEQQPDVLPVPQISVLEEADTSVGSFMQAWLNV